MSGGGIVKLNDNYTKLIGIQSQMTNTFSEQNEIDFLPIIYFVFYYDSIRKKIQ